MTDIEEIQQTTRAAYHRAADLAASYAEHWEREASATKDPHTDSDEAWFLASLKAGHWRIIEKEIRALADD
jgi:hypothetical protein